MSKIILIGIIAVVLFLGAAIIWPTIGLVGYISVSLMKGQLRMYIPWLFGFWGYILDMGMACLAIAGVWRVYLRERRIGEIFAPRGIWVCLIVLAVWIWIRLPATRDPDLGMIKTLVFSIFDTTVIVLGLLYGRTQAGLRRIARALIAVGVIAVIGVLAFGRPEQEWEGSRMTFGGATSLAIADMAAYPVIVLIGLWLAKQTYKSMVIMVAAVIFSTGAILMTGSRGPFFTLAPALLVMAYLYRRQVNFKVIITAASLIGIAIFAFRYYRAVSSEIISSRFGFTEIQNGIMVRVDMVKVSLAGWANSPFLGTGPGDFNVQMLEGAHMMKYPHNLILEVANELGLIGLIPYLLMLFYGFKSLKVLSRPELDGSEFKMYAMITLGCFIYHLIASLKTGGYAGSPMFYLFWGATISMAKLGFYECMQLQEYYGQDENEMLDSEITGQDQEIVL